MNPVMHVTVAAVARADGRFLLVEERIEGALVVNQPAGHWEPGETLEQAVIRETLEETGWGFRPHGLVGVYQWLHPDGRDIFLRFAFHGDAARPLGSSELDTGIERVVWHTADEIRQSATPARSPLVLRCIEDFENGERYALDCLKDMLAPQVL